MMKKYIRQILAIALCALSSIAFAQEQFIRAYMQQVYPSSETFKRLSDAELRDYYANSLNTWYRTPIPGYESGLLDKRIEPQYKVFVFPDTAARARTDLDNRQRLAKQGFADSKAILGSNRDYIEISSLAWMSFPYGAYYNWAHGSGIFLYTGGKSIIGYTKVDVLYKIYAKRRELNHYYQKLGSTSMVRRQIFGTDLPVDKALDLYVQDHMAGQYESVFDSRQFTAKHFHIEGGVPPLAAVLLREKSWGSSYQKIKALVQKKDYEGAYRILLIKYVEDHRLGKFSQDQERYQYLAGEAKPDIDEWMYDAAKAEGYNVVQMTFEPNSMGQPTFEICDLRWPKLSNIPNIDVDAIDKGYQHYSISFAWKKMEAFLTKRDPFDLMNHQKAIPITVEMPNLNETPNPLAIFNPPPGYPQSWLPAKGWGIEQAVGDYHQTDIFPDWIKLRPAPKGLQLPNGEGRFVTWGLNGANDFSFIDVERNKNILLARAKMLGQ